LKHFLKYNLIGVVNTLITLFIVWLLNPVLGLNIILSNFIGYVFGAVNSYVLNRNWNFRARGKHSQQIPRFALAFALGYAVNILTLLVANHLLEGIDFGQYFPEGLRPWLTVGYLAHIAANVAYVLFTFTLLQKLVFPDSQRAETSENQKKA